MHPGQQAVAGKALEFQFDMLRIGNFTAAFIDKRGRYQQGCPAFIYGRTQPGVRQTYQQTDDDDRQKKANPAPVTQGISAIKICILPGRVDNVDLFIAV